MKLQFMAHVENVSLNIKVACGLPRNVRRQCLGDRWCNNVPYGRC